MAFMSLVLVMSTLSCSGKQPSSLGVSDGELAPCPSSPNCVSSDATDPEHRVEPFLLAGDPADAWPVISEEVARLPRTTLVDQTTSYLHAECASAVFRFVDDLELQLRAASNVVAIRSASRVGRSDLGVNRRRVERLREALRRRGVIR